VLTHYLEDIMVKAKKAPAKKAAKKPAKAAKKR
jgi:hypothetical protein